MLKIKDEFKNSYIKFGQKPTKKIELLTQSELNELYKANHPAVYLEKTKEK